jgi:hypothetical protein
MRRHQLVAVLVALFLSLAVDAAFASFVGDKCSPNHYPDYYVKRSEAQAYSIVADNEGYEWGGGCWNNNNRDDTPGEPDSNGEGPDCSGFTFKTWELMSQKGQSGFMYWDKLENIHGPYGSWDFWAPEPSEPFRKLGSKSRANTLYMDAFAKNGHVGMLYTDANPGPNTDYIIEALGDASGTDLNIQGYRYQSEYVAVRRKDWTPECWPKCQGEEGPEIVVVP